MNPYRNNKQSNFTVKLGYQIQISEDEWEVSLAEIITPIEVLNISEGNNFFFLAFPNHSVLESYGIEPNTDVCTYSNGCDEYKLVIPPGHYTSPYSLVEENQSSFVSFEGGLLKRDYNQNSNRLKITAQNDKQVRLKFLNDFGQILGINPLWLEKSVGNENDAFTYSVDLNAPYDRLLLKPGAEWWSGVVEWSGVEWSCRVEWSHRVEWSCGVESWEFNLLLSWCKFLLNNVSCRFKLSVLKVDFSVLTFRLLENIFEKKCPTKYLLAMKEDKTELTQKMEKSIIQTFKSGNVQFRSAQFWISTNAVL